MDQTTFFKPVIHFTFPKQLTQCAVQDSSLCGPNLKAGEMESRKRSTKPFCYLPSACTVIPLYLHSTAASEAWSSNGSCGSQHSAVFFTLRRLLLHLLEGAHKLGPLVSLGVGYVLKQTLPHLSEQQHFPVGFRSKCRQKNKQKTNQKTGN